jgi:hypothetical protein
MSIAFRARTSSAIIGATCALCAASHVRVVDARTSRDVFGTRSTSSATSGDAARERGEAVLGRAARREIGRAWNAAIDGAFGAGVKALSERKL